MKLLHISTCLTLCVTLAACGGAPSAGEIKKAVLDLSAQENAAMRKMTGGFGVNMPKGPEIKNVNKIGCKEDGEKAYRCDVEVELDHNGQVNKGPMSLRFIKGSDGWLVGR